MSCAVTIHATAPQTEDGGSAMESWEIPVGHVFLAYEMYCQIRGEEPDPKLLGHTVEIRGGEARLFRDRFV